MAAFVTLDEYEDFVGEVTDPVKATVALEAACDVVRRYIGQQVDAVQNDSIVVIGTGTRAFLLPELPVIGVDSITIDGTAVTDYTVDRTAGLVWRGSGGYWPYDTAITVVYDHGFTVVPGDIKLVAYKLAQSAYTNIAGSVRQETVGPFSVSYGSEDQPLTALNRRVVKKVPLP